jgi:hypothetical protein
MSSIEEKLWEYIDGTCTAEEQKAISLLIEQDETYRQKYRELLSFNADMATMEMDEPSMAFTYKVMENIRADYAQQPLKAAITPNIIKVIALFFVGTIAALLIFMLVNINWSAGNSSTAPVSNFPEMKNFLSGSVLKGFLFFDVVLLLFLFDGFLHKGNLTKQSS